MWYVSGINTLNSAGNAISKVSNVTLHMNSKCILTLTESTSNKTRIISSKDSAKFFDFLAARRPYGVAPFPQRDCWLVVETDKHSVQLYEQVADVQKSEVERSSPLLKSDSLRQACLHVGAVGPAPTAPTLILFRLANMGHMTDCTLFHYMTWMQYGWDGDEYVIFGKPFSGPDFEESAPDEGDFVRTSVPIWRYTFKDVSKVRALLSKASVFKVNPLVERIGERWF